MEEIWKPVVGWEGKYTVSNLGKVRSERSGKLLSIVKTDNGYLKVNLGYDTKITIHRLVAFAFIPNPENKRCVNHLNSNRTDNRLENLEWCTHKENSQHAKKLGRLTGKRRFLSAIGENHHRATLKNYQVKEIYSLTLKGIKTKEIMDIYSISARHVYSIKSGENWKSVTGLKRESL